MILRSLCVWVLTILAASLAACSTAQTPPVATAAPADAEYHRRMAQAALEACDHFIRERDVGQQPITFEFLERMHLWALRLTRARYAMSDSPQARVAVVRQYVEEIKRLHRTTSGMIIEEGPRPTFITAYYVAEAELWLETVQRE